MFFRIIVLCVCALLVGCSDEDGVGSIIQPEEDFLHSYSNGLEVGTSTIKSDSVLSKSESLLLGRYVDAKFGEIKAEFLTQLDARLGGGIVLPDTTVVAANSGMSGILNSMLQSVDEKFGLIKSVYSPSNLTVDSVVYIIQYGSDFMGDSTSLQALSVYELTKELTNQHYYTDVDVSEYCDKSNLLGATSFQVKNYREIRIPLKVELGEKLVSIYNTSSDIKTQEDFNSFFKGVYVSHSFNRGTILNVLVSGVLVYYSFDAIISTSYDGRDTVLTSSQIEDRYSINPLVSSVFLSANKAVQRVNAIQHSDLESVYEDLQVDTLTYVFTPSGFYTAVSIPFKSMMDSIRLNAEDTSKVMFNSVKLRFYYAKKYWDTDLLQSANMLLIDKKEVESFFYENKQPDGITSFVSSMDTTAKAYIFNITAATQEKIFGGGAYGDDLVLVPVVKTAVNGNIYYRQQLWLTTALLYGDNVLNKEKRPRLDMVYTKRE
ncbi:MAG: DUF4270 domain-containing protein [Paludibacteraceae bacterium]|nr:DUF4270 domain-containing protein [Paludibacteraceae bacterium]